MNLIVLMFITASVVVLAGTIIMYEVESKVPNTKIKTLLDSLWWCVATVTTVGYGDIVPISNTGRVVGIVFMFFGITMIATLLSVVSTKFYKKRFEKAENERREREFNNLKVILVNKLSDIEEKEIKFMELVNSIRTSLEDKK
jgi:voltage-gated potassium channel Kch